MFGRDDSHLELLVEYGLGTGDGGAWWQRLGDATESPAEMMLRQVDWAQAHGFERRLALLARFRDAVNRVADFSKIEG